MYRIVLCGVFLFNVAFCGSASVAIDNISVSEQKLNQLNINENQEHSKLQALSQEDFVNNANINFLLINRNRLIVNGYHIQGVKQ